VKQLSHIYEGLSVCTLFNPGW